MALRKVEVTRVEYGAVFGPRARPSSGGGVSLDFRSGACLKIHHQEISGLFCRLNFDECLGRFDAFHGANPAHTTLCLNSKNVKRSYQMKRAPNQCREAIPQLRAAQDTPPATLPVPEFQRLETVVGFL